MFDFKHFNLKRSYFSGKFISSRLRTSCKNSISWLDHVLWVILVTGLQVEVLLCPIFLSNTSGSSSSPIFFDISSILSPLELTSVSLVSSSLLFFLCSPVSSSTLCGTLKCKRCNYRLRKLNLANCNLDNISNAINRFLSNGRSIMRAASLSYST